MEGRLWRLYVLIDGTYQPFAGATQESMSLSVQSVGRANKDKDGFRRMLRVDGGQADLSLSGVAKPSESLDRLRQAWSDKTPLPMYAESNDAVLIGRFFADGYSETGPNNASVQFSTSFKSTGSFSYVIGTDARLIKAARIFHSTIQQTLAANIGAP